MYNVLNVVFKVYTNSVHTAESLLCMAMNVNQLNPSYLSHNH